MPTLYDPAQVERLIKSVERLEESIENLQRKLAKNRRELIILGVLVVAVGIVAAIAITAARDVRSVASATNRDRAANTEAGCVQFNVQQEQDRMSLKSSLAALARGPLTSEQVGLLGAYAVAVDESQPYRDCSPEGIKAYYQSPPTDPATR